MSSRALKVLIVDDEPQIVRALRAGLRAGGYEVVSASDGDSAVRAATADTPDVMILDLSMAPVDGFEVVERVRQSSAVPIIVLSVRDSDQDKVRALDLGADDYLVKPFSLDELLARIRVALRHAERTTPSAPAIQEYGPLQIDLDARVVTRRGEEVKLTPKEFALLKVLIENAGKVLTQRVLLQKVWGPEYGDEAAYLHVYIGQLRRKLEDDPSRPRLIVTEPGVGYRFRLDA
ncbi:MAG: response regulator transcription factor [Chloroflexi bacterium]|nr:response regulator transcription factor [Chloroflexota bacterium]